MSILSWLGQRQVKRIDEIEKNYVNGEALKRMQVERKEMHRQNTEKLNRIDTKLDGVRDSVIGSIPVLTQRLDTVEERVEELRDFKHEHCEPAVRYVDYLKTEKPWEGDEQ